MYKKESNGFLKFVAVCLGGSLIASNFYALNLLNRRTGLPIFNLPVSEYSAYDIEATKEGYKLSHRMHDPKILHSLETTNRPAGFFGAGKATVNKSSEVVAGQNIIVANNGKLDAETIACIEERAKGGSTGALIGTSVATGTGMATKLAGVPIVGWFLSGFATNTARREGEKIGRNMAADFSDC